MGSAGFNKLVEEHKIRTMHLREKLKFVVKTLTDQDARAILQAYNGIKEKYHLQTKGDSKEAIKGKIVNKLRNKGFDLQCQAFKQLVDNCKLASSKTKSKDKIMKSVCYRISDKAKRQLGQAIRQLRAHAKAEFLRIRKETKRLRGIINRCVDGNTRLMGMGF